VCGVCGVCVWCVCVWCVCVCGVCVCVVCVWCVCVWCVCVWCVCVPLGTQHGMRMRHIFICGLSSSTIFLYIFREKKFTELKICESFVYWTVQNCEC